MNDNPTPTPTASTTSSNSERARSAKEVTSARRKFANLTNGRVSRAVQAIRVVANLSKLAASKDQMSDADVAKIMDRLNVEVAHARARLEAAATGQQLDVEFDIDGNARTV